MPAAMVLWQLASDSRNALSGQGVGPLKLQHPHKAYSHLQLLFGDFQPAGLPDQ